MSTTQLSRRVVLACAWLFAFSAPGTASGQELGILSSLLKEFSAIGATYSPIGVIAGSEVFETTAEARLENWGVFVGSSQEAPRLRVGLETITGFGLIDDEPAVRGGIRILPSIAAAKADKTGKYIGVEVGAASLWRFRASQVGPDGTGATLRAEGSGFSAGPFAGVGLPVGSQAFPWVLQLEVAARYIQIPSIDWIRGKDEVVTPPGGWPVGLAEWMIHLSVRVALPIS